MKLSHRKKDVYNEREREREREREFACYYTRQLLMFVLSTHLTTPTHKHFLKEHVLDIIRIPACYKRGVGCPEESDTYQRVKW